MDGQLCYKADMNMFRDEVDKTKYATEGFVFFLDNNENRMVEVGEELKKKERSDESIIYIETVGKSYRSYWKQIL